MVDRDLATLSPERRSYLRPLRLKPWRTADCPSNSPDDFTIAHARVLKPLARAGACVIAIDHLAKNTESRAAGPTGTAAKRRAVGGVSLRVALEDPHSHPAAAGVLSPSTRTGTVD
jgi:hypothetical protein